MLFAQHGMRSLDLAGGTSDRYCRLVTAAGAGYDHV
jgi:hypothetical protein